MSKRSIEPLNMHDALLLHALIAPYIEEPDETTLTAEFLGGMLNRMIERDAGVYVRCVELMIGKPEVEILKMGSLDVLKLFMDGLRANQIMTLYRFGKGLGYA